jgi:glyoxylase-like metal-dependent hydrolase (beta-lactamase superfamily II)
MTISTRSRSFAPTRRAFCLCCALAMTHAGAGGWLTPRDAAAQAQGIVDRFRAAAAGAPIHVHRLRGGVSMLEGSGGNIAVLVGREGKLLVDAGITASRPRITEALASLGAEPVRHLINTHWHFDHTDGNEWLQATGVTITAHTNSRRYLSMTQRVEDWDYDFPPSPPGAIPTRIVTEEDVLRFNGSTVMLRHYGPSHTDGDLSVFFAEADILHTGDTFWNGFYPFIDYSTGGSIDGMIRAAEANLRAATDRTIVIPGHGPAGDRRQLQEYRDMLVAIRTKVADLKRQGRSLEETIAAKPTASHDARWRGFVADPGGFFTKLVYAGV